MTLDGVVCLSLKPKSYTKNTSYWEDHSETKELNEVFKEVEASALRKQNLIATSIDCSLSNETDNDDIDDDNVIEKEDSSAESVENTFSLLPND